MKKFLIFVLCFLALAGCGTRDYADQGPEHIVIYRDSSYFCAFPSVIKDGKGFTVAFRRAPERRLFGERYSHHTDPNSYLVKMSSKDGRHWSGEPSLLYAHPFGGSQDPCLLRLRSGETLCASYLWCFLRQEGLEALRQPSFRSIANSVFGGGFMLRSKGEDWENLPVPVLEDEINNSPLGGRIPAYNRGALYEGRDGKVYWAVVSNDSIPCRRTSLRLLVSADKGGTWEASGTIAADTKVSFNETSMYETPAGDLVAFIRTAGMDDEACIARSKDGGKTFSWQGMGFQGHPCHALRLPDNRVLLTYGYRHKPFGIRGRILNAECTDFSTAPEFVIREGTNNGDIGYPWSVMLDSHHALVVYYFNENDGPRYVAGTILPV